MVIYSSFTFFVSGFVDGTRYILFMVLADAVGNV